MEPVDVVRQALTALVDRDVQRHLSFVASEFAVVHEIVNSPRPPSTEQGRATYAESLALLADRPPDEGFRGFEIRSVERSADGTADSVLTNVRAATVATRFDGTTHGRAQNPDIRWTVRREMIVEMRSFGRGTVRIVQNM